MDFKLILSLAEIETILQALKNFKKDFIIEALKEDIEINEIYKLYNETVANDLYIELKELLIKNNIKINE